MEIEVEEETENGEAIKDQGPLHPPGEVTVIRERQSRVRHARDKLYLEKRRKNKLLGGMAVVTWGAEEEEEEEDAGGAPLRDLCRRAGRM